MATDQLVAVVFVSWGRWVAACPRPHCGTVEMIGRCDDGSDGGLTGDRFTCRPSHGGCGLVCEPVWPGNVDAIETLLSARPVKANRNWSPGETIVDLMAENLEHGHLIPQPVADLVLTAAMSRQIGA